MSEFVADPAPSTTLRKARSADDIGPVTHEAYAFACMNCGFGWEQAYEIGHQVDREGLMHARYRANGVPVPSPLTKPSCPGCGGEHVRIMRAGRVTQTIAHWHAPAPERPSAREEEAHPEPPAPPARQRRRLHLPFHFRLRREHHTTPEA
ncbi:MULTISPECIES: hypothetical protein [unclassified Streptacidiphilus]|uniref:Uncharacterized protein n=2 Tax=Streptacidiphilus TaxID=228398 RepID=A0ABV6ULQ9_9ACTN